MKMTKNKNLKKVLFLLTMCILALLIYKIIEIYAVFHSEVEANVRLENGVWNITVNGTTISTGVETQFVIDQITTAEDVHVKPDKLAPGLSGSFEIAISPEDTNVSLKYDITLNQEELGNSNLKIKSIQETENGYQLIKTAENTYTGVITLQDINNGIRHKIKMEVEWADDGTNDENDAETGKKHQIQIPIEFHAIQYLGEEITPVTEEQNQE